ncbi:hypothetical protein ACFSGI_00580 [Paenibacillus nicotianae]|uniref:DUF3221 domain-containing protein n=1 Tax=Paenibacillus nicotianae TaxID=1526551 RepID=A0ABW4ULM5_9BACL
MNFLNKKRSKWLLAIIFLLVFMLALVLSFFKSGGIDRWNKPDTQQQYYLGTITKIEEKNNRIDGEVVLYEIILDNKTMHSVSKNSKFYKMIDNYAQNDKTLGYTKVREETTLSNISVGEKVELWKRQLNNHLSEIYELTVLE